MRTFTEYQTETRTRTFTDSNGNQVTQNYTIQIPATEQVEEVVQVARTQADVIRETDATAAQSRRNIQRQSEYLVSGIYSPVPKYGSVWLTTTVARIHQVRATTSVAEKASFRMYQFFKLQAIGSDRTR